MKHELLTHRIIGCAMAVHSTLGSGYPEVIYQRAMALELEAASLAFEREITLPVFYKRESVGSLRADFFVEGKVLLELKSVTELDDTHLAQALNYLESFEKETGLLLNFGSDSLTFKRLFNKKFNSD